VSATLSLGTRRAAGRVLLTIAGLAVSVAGLTGCEADSYMDPSVTGRWENTPTTVPILERLSAIEGPIGPAAVETTSVRPEDLIPEVETYRLGPGDALEVRIQDLFRPDVEEAFPRPVDPRGYIDIPRVGRLFVDGLTEEDVQSLVAQTLLDKGLFSKDPVVSVAVTAPRRSTYNILGGVGDPGLYPIPRPDYRLLEALTAAGRFSENAQSVYVIRYIPLTEKVLRGSGPKAPSTTPAGPGTPGATPAPSQPSKPPESVIDLIDELSKPKDTKPAGPAGSPGIMPGMMASSRVGMEQPPAKDPGKEPPVDLPGDAAKPAAVPPDPQAKPAEPAPVDAAPAEAAPAPAPAPIPPEEKFWVFRDGKWMQVTRVRPAGPGAAVAMPSPSRPTAPGPGGEAMPVPGMPPPEGPVTTRPPAKPDPLQPPSVPGAEKLVTQRVIEVPLAPLLAGSAQFNVVIRPGDVIRVPTPPEGIIYVTGEVNRPGTFTLPANGKLTIERAIASAGGLSNLAIPERIDLTRMVAPDRQATIRLNYRAIAERTMPDIFLKPDDVINVGTNFWAFPLAVIRQGFRMSYGFGFVLDRNFDENVYGPRRSNN